MLTLPVPGVIFNVIGCILGVFLILKPKNTHFMFLAITQQRKVKITLMTPFWKGEGQGFQMDEKQIEFKF